MVAAVLALLLLLPVTSDGGERFDCGPAVTTAFGLTRPPEGDVDVGLDVGGEPMYVARWTTCRRAAIERMILSAELVIAATVILVVRRRRQSAEQPSPVPASIEP